MRAASLLLFVSFLFTACKTAPEARPQGPAHTPITTEPFTLTGIAVSAQSLVDVTLAVSGKVAEGVTERRLSWTAKAGTSTLGEGEALLDVDADGRFSLPVVVSFGRSLSALAPYQRDESLEVVVTARLGEGSKAPEASRSRAVRSPLLPAVSIATVRASRTAARAVELTYLVMVHNPNPYEVRVGTLSYTAKLGGKTVATGALPLGRALPASAQSEFELPAELNVENATGDFDKMMREKSLEWQFTGSVDARAFEVPFDLSGVLPISQGG